ncbi:MAG: glycosyltransferase family 39 protein, partial [Candidatus Aerophobetes bacterium]|nr:glycosyltransferase family 39 protein [Candidatus Aerophobetes bacterium]
GVITVYFLGKSIFNPRVGFLSGLILATSLQYIIQSRLALLDVPLSFFISLSVLFFYLGYTIPNKRWCYLLSYVSMALATLTKGPIGVLLPILIIGLYLLLTKEFGELKNMMLFRGIIIYLAIASPWYIIELIRHGDTFINNFFLQRTVARFLTPFEGHTGPFYYFIPVLFLGFFPWSSFLPYSFIHLISLGEWEAKASPTQRDENSLVGRGNFSRPIIYKFLHLKKGWKSEEGKKSLLILLWFAVIFVFFSSAKSKLPGYIFPLYPSVALAVGKLWDNFLSPQGQHHRKGIVASFTLFFALLIILLLVIMLIAKPLFPVEYGLFGRD